MTPAQCKAARALLDIEQKELAAGSGLHAKTVSRYEGSLGAAMDETVDMLRVYLEEQGLTFVCRGVVFTADFLRDARK